MNVTTLGEISVWKTLGWPLLSCMIALPLLGAVLALLVPRGLAVRVVAGLASTATLALSVIAVVYFRPDDPALQLVERSSVGLGPLHWHVGVDGMSLFFLPFSALLSCATIVAARERLSDPKLMALTLVLESIALAIFCTLDMAVLVVFWFLTAVPAYLLLRRDGAEELATQTARMLAVGAVPLGGVLAVLATNPGVAPEMRFDWAAHVDAGVPPALQPMLLALVTLATCVRMPLFPFHGWAIRLLTHGMLVANILVAGVPVGAYVFLRLALSLSPSAFAEYEVLLVVLGLVSTAYGAVLALAQTDLRAVLAFLELSAGGLLIVGIASLELEGIAGALLQASSAYLCFAGLHVVTTMVSERTGTTDFSSLGGLSSRLSVFSVAFLVLGLGAVGFPGTVGFVSEHLLMHGAAHISASIVLVCLIFVNVSGVALWWSWSRTFQGTARTPAALRAPLPQRFEVAVLLALCAIVLLAGWWVERFLGFTHTAIEIWLFH